MQEIKVYDSDKRRIQALWQWDREVMLYINEPSITQAFDLHFFTDRSETAYVVHSTYDNGTLSAKIPNVLLRESRPIIGSIFTIDGEEGRIEYYFVIVIRRRPKPTDYIQIGSADTEDYVSIAAIRLDCADFAAQALASADSVADISAEAKSYAVGGTGTRDGENTDNAKFYSEQASNSENAAEEAERNAKKSEDNSASSANQSKQSADQAADYAAEALALKNSTQSFADDANESKNISAGHASAALKSEENASISEANALTYKNAASQSEQNAKASELAAKQSEETVLGTIDEAAESATLSESWAVGGTNSRNGEDTNNSKYFSQQASQHNNNALTHETAAKSYAMGGTGSRAGEDTDNAKYYYAQLQTMMGNLSFATVDETLAYLGYQ